MAASPEVRGVILNNYADFVITEWKWLAGHEDRELADSSFKQAGRFIAEAKRLEVVVPVIYATEAQKELEWLALHRDVAAPTEYRCR